MTKQLRQITAYSFFLLLSTASDAQIILKPTYWSSFCTCTSPSGDPGTCWDTGVCAGFHFWHQYVCNHSFGYVEFALNATEHGGVFPPPGMTEYNWGAWLSGIEVFPYAPQADAIDLYYYMQNRSEEGGFWYGYPSNFIATLYPNTQIDPIEITELLRQDLFHSVPGASTSRFYILNPYNPQYPYDACCLGVDSLKIWVIGDFPPPPTATPTPIPTPTPVRQPGVELSLSGQVFEAGDRFLLQASCKGLPDTNKVVLFVALDAFGEYWFYPEWDHLPDSVTLTLHNDLTAVEGILDFEWPSGDFGEADGLKFWAGICRPFTYDVIGTIDCVDFGYR